MIARDLLEGTIQTCQYAKPAYYKRYDDSIEASYFNQEFKYSSAFTNERLVKLSQKLDQMVDVDVLRNEFINSIQSVLLRDYLHSQKENQLFYDMFNFQIEKIVEKLKTKSKAALKKLNKKTGFGDDYNSNEWKFNVECLMYYFVDKAVYECHVSFIDHFVFLGFFQ